jgi:hypothetical protein
VQGIEGAELLGHHQRRMVGQHDAASADADVRVALAISLITSDVAAEPMPGMSWCSAIQ